jgi:folate-binding protein YgfZ
MSDLFPPTRLEDRAVIAVNGPEAASFLHNLVSANIEALSAGEATHALLLTPQGKILFDFFVVRQGDGFLVDIDRASAEAFRKRLTMYKLRAQVTIAARDDLAVIALPPDDAFRDAVAVFVDPRLAAMGGRAIVSVDSAPAPCKDSLRAYERRRISIGLAAFGRDYQSGETVPHDVNADQFTTVDFRKGCYIGQEIVSRMKHRNTARKRLVHVRPADASGELPQSGTVIKADFREIGTMGSSVDGVGLAIVRLDWAKHARDTGVAITADGVALDVTLLAYAGFGWPAESIE